MLTAPFALLRQRNRDACWICTT